MSEYISRSSKTKQTRAGRQEPWRVNSSSPIVCSSKAREQAFKVDADHIQRRKLFT